MGTLESFLEQLETESKYELTSECALLCVQLEAMGTAYDFSNENFHYVHKAVVGNLIKLIKDFIYLLIGVLALLCGGFLSENLRGFVLNEAAIVELNVLNTIVSFVSILPRSASTLFNLVLGTNETIASLDLLISDISWNQYGKSTKGDGKKGSEGMGDKSTFFRSPVDHVIVEAICGESEEYSKVTPN